MPAATKVDTCHLTVPLITEKVPRKRTLSGSTRSRTTPTTTSTGSGYSSGPVHDSLWRYRKTTSRAYSTGGDQKCPRNNANCPYATASFQGGPYFDTPARTGKPSFGDKGNAASHFFFAAAFYGAFGGRTREAFLGPGPANAYYGALGHEGDRAGGAFTGQCTEEPRA